MLTFVWEMLSQPGSTTAEACKKTVFDLHNNYIAKAPELCLSCTNPMI